MIKRISSMKCEGHTDDDCTNDLAIIIVHYSKGYTKDKS